MKALMLLMLVSSVIEAAPRCVEHDGLPDSACTPGVVDPRVTQENIKQTICNTHYSDKGSWSKTWRPPVSVTNKLKAERAKAYADPLPLDCYEGDHMLLESAGGCPGPTPPSYAPAGVQDNTWQVPAGKHWCDFTANFWDEPWGHAPHWAAHCGPQRSHNAHDKDKIEDKIHNLICAGKISLAEGQAAIMHDWEAAYEYYIGPLPGGAR